MMLFLLLSVVCARRPARSYMRLVSYFGYVTLLIPGTRGTRSKRSCQSDHPVIPCEEALARGWRGELYLYKTPALVRAWKVRRTIAAAVCYRSTLLRSVVTRHKLRIGQLVVSFQWPRCRAHQKASWPLY